METESKEIINYSSIHNNNDISYNYKITTNNLEKEENDFPFKDRELHDNSLKYENQSLVVSNLNNKSKNPNSDFRSENLENISIKSKCNDSNLNLNNKEISIEAYYTLEESKILENLKAHFNKGNTFSDKLNSNLNLNKIVSNNMNNKINKNNDKNKNNKEQINTNAEALNNDEKNYNNQFDLNDKSLKLRETRVNNGFDLESLCNSRGEMNKSFNEHLGDFNLDLKNQAESENGKEFNENLDVDSKKRLEKFTILADSENAKKMSDSKKNITNNKNNDNNEANYKEKNIGDDIFNENENNKNLGRRKEANNGNQLQKLNKDNFRSKSNKKFENDLQNRKSSLAKKEKILKDEDFKKNFLINNNLNKLNNNNNNKKTDNKNVKAFEHTETNIDLNENDEANINASENMKKLEDNLNKFSKKEKILSPKNTLIKNKTDYSISLKLPTVKTTKNPMPNVDDNSNNINNVKAFTTNEKNKLLIKKLDAAVAEKEATKKRAFSEKGQKRILIKEKADKDLKKETLNLTKEEINSESKNKENLNKNNNEDSDKLVRKLLKNRTSEYLKTLNLKIKTKMLEDQEKQKKEENMSKKIKENLGFSNVKSKLLEPKKEIEDEYPESKSKNKSLNKINKLKPNSENKKKSNTPLTQETSDTLEFEDKEENNSGGNNNADKEKGLKNVSEKNKFSNSSTHLNTMKKLCKKNICKQENALESAGDAAENNEINNDNIENNNENNNNYNSENENKAALESTSNNKQKNTHNPDKNSNKIKDSDRSNQNNSKNTKKPITKTKKTREKEAAEAAALAAKKPDPSELKEKLQQQLEKEKIIIQERILKLKNCYTIEDWKRRNRVDTEKHVFICFNGYPDMRKALLDRSWIENVDPTSNFYDFKYALSARNIEFSAMQKNQFVNHFEKNSELTRKVSLSKNLKNLLWFRNVDINSFFPRCYDLSDVNDTESFADDFKVTKAQALLKIYCADAQVVSLEKVKAAMNVVERKLKCLAEILDCDKFNFHLCSEKEWDIINNNSDSTKEFPKNNNNEDNLGKQRNRRSKELKPLEAQADEKIRAKSLDIKIKKIQQKNKNEEVLIQNDSLYREKVSILLHRLKEKNPQTEMDGNRNIWIIKPSGLSRGRGIKCADDLEDILNQVKSGANQFIIQKYIENPLIINKRKFDIRQWVLVTNWNPLTIYVYDEPYVRFGAEDYDPENIQNLYSHLTNNAIGKNSDLFECSEIKGNMWEMSQFSQYLQEITKRLVKSVMEDTCKVIIDNILSKNKSADTGLWKKVYKGVKVDEITVTPGFELVIEGNRFNPRDEIKLD